jgi:KipI family sensor histidine kinase inhibitor
MDVVAALNGESSECPLEPLAPKFFDCGESALLVELSQHHDRQLNLAILDLSARLDRSAPPGYRESIPALASLTVLYDPLILPRPDLIATIEGLCSRASPAIHGRSWIIPIHYGGKSGLDLADVAAATGLSANEVIACHSSEVYHVQMLGFLPGFAYLGDLPAKLRLPRRATPRTRVAAGSVAIAAEMTAIYPLESPGGWHLIGWTPIPPWDVARLNEPLLLPGDEVRFRPVDAAEAEAIQRRVADGWIPKPEPAEAI